MARILPPPPIKGDLPTPFRDWLNKLYTFLGDTTNLILWNQIDTAGSSLSDITTRPHSLLQAVSGSTEQVHVSATERTNLQELADGTDTTLHFHDSDRARANHTGTQTASTISDFNTAADVQVSSGITTHVGLSDPHTQYALEANLAAVATSGSYADITGTPIIKAERITTGSVGAGSTALVTLTWAVAFADANYTPQASVLDSTTSSLSLSVVHIESFSATDVKVRILNNALGAITGTLLVTAIHD